MTIHGVAHGKRVETSASVCLRPVLLGRGLCASRSASAPGWTSSLMAVSSGLLGEAERCQNTPLQLASMGKSKGWSELCRSQSISTCPKVWGCGQSREDRKASLGRPS